MMMVVVLADPLEPPFPAMARCQCPAASPSDIFCHALLPLPADSSIKRSETRIFTAACRRSFFLPPLPCETSFTWPSPQCCPA